jgi:tetrahydromethanopterin S-methyltransferase subunit G
LALDITDANKRVRELGEKVGAKFEREDRFQELTRRQSEIEEKLDLTKNQAPSQVEAASVDQNGEKNSETQNKTNAVRPKHRVSVSV